MKLKIGRIVTVGYMALIKIDRKIQVLPDNTIANWYDVKQLKNMSIAFDHAEIIEKALEHIRFNMDRDQQLFFELLPRKFTMSQLRQLFDKIHNTRSDIRNFHLMVAQWPYVVPLNETETGVPHRAARLYKFKK